MASTFEWTAERITTLTSLWNEKKTTLEIAVILGCTRSVVIGKAHRLCLSARPSPIQRDNTTREELLERVLIEFKAGKSTAEMGVSLGRSADVIRDAVRTLRRMGKLEAPTATLPPLASEAAPSIVWQYKPFERQPPVPPPPTLPATAPVAAVAKQQVTGRVTPCCWPIGEPRTKSFRYCEQPSDPGRPYCAEHCGVAYMKPRSNLQRLAA